MGYTLASSKNNKKYECKDIIREQRLNVCQFSKAISSSILLSSIVKEVMKSANFEISCPFKPSLHIVSNMTFTFPTFFPMPPGFYCVDVAFNGRVKNQRKLVTNIKINIKCQLK